MREKYSLPGKRDLASQGSYLASEGDCLASGRSFRSRTDSISAKDSNERKPIVHSFCAFLSSRTSSIRLEKFASLSRSQGKRLRAAKRSEKISSSGRESACRRLDENRLVVDRRRNGERLIFEEDSRLVWPIHSVEVRPPICAATNLQPGK